MSNNQIYKDLIETKIEQAKLLEAIDEFREKRKAVENSQSDAFNHQGGRVQRRQYELKQARERLYSFLEEDG